MYIEFKFVNNNNDQQRQNLRMIFEICFRLSQHNSIKIAALGHLQSQSSVNKKNFWRIA